MPKRGTVSLQKNWSLQSRVPKNEEISGHKPENQRETSDRTGNTLKSKTCDNPHKTDDCCNRANAANDPRPKRHQQQEQKIDNIVHPTTEKITNDITIHMPQKWSLSSSVKCIFRKTRANRILVKQCIV